MESASKPPAPSFTWPLAPSKPRARTPITAKPVGQAPLAPLPRVPRASVPPPMAVEPVRAAPAPVEVVPAWIEPVRVEPPPIQVEPAPVYVAPAPALPEIEPETDRDPEPFTELAAMSTFGAGVLNARRGPNKFFLFALLLAAIAVGVLLLR
ncbi:MAG TPA: hypothetical protein VIV58_16930 [Kofleriaceae bacterium]